MTTILNFAPIRTRRVAPRLLFQPMNMVEAHLHKATAAKALGKMEIVREVSHTLAAIEAEKFRRVR